LSAQTRANLAIAAAVFVLFTAMIDARISAAIAFVALIVLAVVEYRSRADERLWSPVGLSRPTSRWGGRGLSAIPCTM